jgi:hypothetical protein
VLCDFFCSGIVFWETDKLCVELSVNYGLMDLQMVQLSATRWSCIAIL